MSNIWIKTKTRQKRHSFCERTEYKLLDITCAKKLIIDFSKYIFEITIWYQKFTSKYTGHKWNEFAAQWLSEPQKVYLYINITYCYIDISIKSFFWFGVCIWYSLLGFTHPSLLYLFCHWIFFTLVMKDDFRGKLQIGIEI